MPMARVPVSLTGQGIIITLYKKMYDEVRRYGGWANEYVTFVREHLCGWFVVARYHVATGKRTTRSWGSTERLQPALA